MLKIGLFESANDFFTRKSSANFKPNRYLTEFIIKKLS